MRVKEIHTGKVLNTELGKQTTQSKSVFLYLQGLVEGGNPGLCHTALVLLLGRIVPSLCMEQLDPQWRQ